MGARLDAENRLSYLITSHFISQIKLTYFALAILGESLLQRLVINIPVQHPFSANQVGRQDKSEYQDRPPT